MELLFATLPVIRVSVSLTLLHQNARFIGWAQDRQEIGAFFHFSNFASHHAASVGFPASRAHARKVHTKTERLEDSEREFPVSVSSGSLSSAGVPLSGLFKGWD
jgi:hypothetical protein